MKIFPKTWNICEADTVCAEIIDCINKTAPVVEYQTAYKMIRTTNVRDGRINLDITKYVEEVIFNKWTRRVKPRKYDIILTREAPLGEVGLLRSEENVMLGQRTMLYRADPSKLDQNYLFYSLIGPYVQAQIRGQGNGSTVEHLRVPDAKKLKIPVAPLKEQRKIAAILSSYDELIENNKRRIALLEKMAEEIYREWFVRMRFPGHECSNFIKNIPSNWVLDKASSFFRVVKGKSYGSDEITENVEHMPFITLKSFNRGGGYRESGLKYYSGRYTEEQIVRLNDIVMAVTDMTQERAVIGRVARIPDFGDKGAVISLDVIKLVPKNISKVFLYSYMRYSGFADFIKEFANGANVLHLKPDLVAQQKILMPPSLLQEDFSKKVEPIYRQIDRLTIINKCLGEVRDMLLPKLISGKLSVEGLDIKFPPGMQESVHVSNKREAKNIIEKHLSIDDDQLQLSI